MSKINGLLITGLLAILGTVLGSIINGCMDANLSEQKFQSELIIKALESSNRNERAELLKFLIEANLISRKNLKTGIHTYLEKNPEGIPQFSAILKMHEFVFYSGQEISSMTQSKADLFCMKKFSELESSGDLQLDPQRVVHKWGHLKSGICIANLKL